jgi:DNA-binding response OmpR family regulator
VTAILILANDPDIEALLGDLVVFAGHRPVFRRDDETTMDALHRRPVSVVLIDTALPVRVVDGCDHAARESAIPIVFVGSEMSEAEVRSFAEARHASHFALPNGPRLLAAVIEGSLRGTTRRDLMPPQELAAAFQAVARARRLGTLAHDLVAENRLLREERDLLLDGARRSRDVMRTVVFEYLTHLRQEGISRHRAAMLVADAIRENAEAVAMPELLVTAERDAQEWVKEVYCAA